MTEARTNVEGQLRAQQVTDSIRDSLVDLIDSGEIGAVIGSAPAGGGKTYFVIETIRRLVEEGRSVLVVTPTNKQVEELVDRAVSAGIDVTLLHGQDRELTPRDGLTQTSSPQEVRDLDPQVVVATVDKAGLSALSDAGLGPFDALILDEAYQVQSNKYLKVGNISRAHLLVGDPGQLKPFSSLGPVDYWTSLREDPLATAVDVMRRYHPEIVAERDFKFPLTRRLDERGAALAQPFYAGHDFEAWIPKGVRRMVMSGSVEDRLDSALDDAALEGWSYVRLPRTDAASKDREIAATLADLAARMIERGAILEDERECRELVPPDVIVGVSTNEQRRLVERALAMRGVRGARVLTANKAQGLECQVALVWHPLAGLGEASAFSLDTGRLCVLMTRHRHALVLVGREGDEELVQGVPPKTPAYPGVDDPTLAGWYSHQRLFRVLLDSN